MGKREFELGLDELLDVGAADVSSLLDLNDTEDLITSQNIVSA